MMNDSSPNHGCHGHERRITADQFAGNRQPGASPSDGEIQASMLGGGWKQK